MLKKTQQKHLRGGIVQIKLFWNILQNIWSLFIYVGLFLIMHQF